MAHMRSKPIPVSTCFNNKSSKEPSGFRLYCIKTRFHTSITSGTPILTNGPPDLSGVLSKCISVHGPHGPVSPISQKLSFSSHR